MRQKVPTLSRGITAVVRAPVTVVADGTGAGVLKYAMVEGDVVVVDPNAGHRCHPRRDDTLAR